MSADSNDYCVEQVFLIHPGSGLLLQHVAIDAVTAHSPDLVAAMLTAISSFVRSSFGAGTGPLTALRVGDMVLTVDESPNAILVAAVRGAVTEPLRARLQQALQTIQRDFSSELLSFDGDAEALAGTRPLLASCLATDSTAQPASGRQS